MKHQFYSYDSSFPYPDPRSSPFSLNPRQLSPTDSKIYMERTLEICLRSFLERRFPQTLQRLFDKVLGARRNSGLLQQITCNVSSSLWQRSWWSSKYRREKKHQKINHLHVGRPKTSHPVWDGSVLLQFVNETLKSFKKKKSSGPEKVLLLKVKRRPTVRTLLNIPSQ